MTAHLCSGGGNCVKSAQRRILHALNLEESPHAVAMRKNVDRSAGSGSSAPALVASLRAERPELKLLQMTAPPIGFVNYGFHGEGVDFIHKPFTGEALARKLRYLLDQPN